MERIDDGQFTTVGFSLKANVKFWEKEVTPFGFDGGGANDTTTMRNEQVTTKWPHQLMDFDDMTFTAAFDPAVLNDIKAMGLKNQLITVNWPDGSKWQFWGWLDKFKVDRVRRNEQPTATVTIIASNQDNAKKEILPIYIPA